MKIALRCTTIVYFAFIICTHGITSEASPVDALQASQKATEDIAYEGELIFSKHLADSIWQTRVHVTRLSSTTQKIEFLSPEAVKGVKIVHTEEGVWATELNREERHQIDEDSGFTIWRKFFDRESMLKFNNIDLLASNYDIHQEESESIANVRCNVYHIDPKHRYRPSCRIWIDPETHMQLKYIRYEPSGDIQEELSFVTIRFEDIEPITEQDTQDLKFIFSKDDKKEKHDKETEIQFEPLEPDWIPRGFTLIKQKTFTGHKGPVHLTEYFDGLAYISIFQRLHDEKDWKDEEHHKHDDHDSEVVKKTERFGRDVFFRDFCGLRIAAVGDIPNKGIIKFLMRIED